MIPFRQACAALLLLAGCGSSPPPPAPNDGGPVGPSDSGVSTFTMSCPSPVGDVTSSVTYTLTASEEPAAPGDTVTYVLTPPNTVGNAPISTTFISSQSNYDLPDGLTVTSATLAAASTVNYTSVTATIDAGILVIDTAGSFPVNGDTYPVPPLTMVTVITASAGQTVSWEPPVSVMGEANASIVGTQTSHCSIENPVALWVTHVVAPDAG